MGDGVEAQIRRVLNEVGRLPVDVDTLDDRSDLYSAGMGSHATVDVMLALEERFEIEFPSRMLNRGTFESIAAISAAVTELSSDAV
jgi:acyl carrier protein